MKSVLSAPPPLGLPADFIAAKLLTAFPSGPFDRIIELLTSYAEATTSVALSRDMLAFARARFGWVAFGHVALRQNDPTRLPFADGSFNTVTLLMLLHHVDDLAAVIAEVGRVLTPGGTLALIDLAPHTEGALLR